MRGFRFWWNKDTAALLAEYFRFVSEILIRFLLSKGKKRPVFYHPDKNDYGDGEQAETEKAGFLPFQAPEQYQDCQNGKRSDAKRGPETLPTFPDPL